MANGRRKALRERVRPCSAFWWRYQDSDAVRNIEGILGLPLLELFDAFDQFRQTRECSVLLFVPFEGTRRRSPHGLPPPNPLSREHTTLAADDYSIFKDAMVAEAHLPSENYTYS